MELTCEVSQTMNLDNYVDVPTRLKLALERWPDLRVQERGYRLETFGANPVLICEVAVFRSPEDQHPAIATAAEPLPGKTSFTRDSELMVGFTSALGRALGYMGIGLNGSIASRNEVEARTALPTAAERPEATQQPPTDAQKRMLRALGHAGPLPTTKAAASNLIDRLKESKPTSSEGDPF